MVKRTRPTLRRDQARETQRRILLAAEERFLEVGYAAASIQSVAKRAGVAVETVYARFGSKMGLLAGILERAILPAENGLDILAQPEIDRIRTLTDPVNQVRGLAAFSRGLLQRTDPVHRILRSAAEADPEAARLHGQDARRRVEGQREYIEILRASGNLGPGVEPEEAAKTYSVLASPETYAFLVHECGWSPEAFEAWLASCLGKLLL